MPLANINFQIEKKFQKNIVPSVLRPVLRAKNLTVHGFPVFFFIHKFAGNIQKTGENRRAIFGFSKPNNKLVTKQTRFVSNLLLFLCSHAFLKSVASLSFKF